MVGYLCATPFHIMTAVTMASGMFAHEQSVLIILDHFAVDEELVKKIRSCNVFEEVILYKSNKKTKLNNVKRLINAFVPPKVMRDAAKMDFTRFFVFALDFIDVAYLIRKFDKKKAQCEFAFADDGIGSYINSAIYKPKKVSELILKLCGRYSLLERIKKLYLLKPAYAVENTKYEFVGITQSEASFSKLKSFVSTVWPCDFDDDINGSILYFEQPYDIDPDGKYVANEIAAAQLAAEVTGRRLFVKMHPRSTAHEAWRRFAVIKTQIPFEAFLIQKSIDSSVMISHNSTAMFSPFVIDNIVSQNSTSFWLINLLGVPECERLKKPLEQLRTAIVKANPDTRFFNPDSKSEFEEQLRSIN